MLQLEMLCSNCITSKSKGEQESWSTLTYKQHTNLHRDSDIFWNGFPPGYLEGLQFWFPYHTLVPSFRELPIYTPPPIGLGEALQVVDCNPHQKSTLLKS